jgi:hypothetical protein
MATIKYTMLTFSFSSRTHYRLVTMVQYNTQRLRIHCRHDNNALLMGDETGKLLHLYLNQCVK